MKKHWLAIPLAASLVLGACGDDDDDDGDAADTEETTTSAAGDSTTTAGGDDTTTTAATGGSVEVGVGDTDAGEALVDPDGMTLYVFLDDPEGSSVCTEECAENWPPLTADEVTAGEGVTGELTLITRDDGTQQVAANGHPLYRFGGDGEAGQATGQGIGDVWFVAGPDGEAVEAA